MKTGKNEMPAWLSDYTRSLIGIAIVAAMIGSAVAAAAASLQMDVGPGAQGTGVDVHSSEPIQSPPAVVMSVLRGFREYPSFIPGMKAIEVLEDKGDYVRARITQRLFYFGSVKIELEGKIAQKDQFVVKMLQGPLREYEATFTLKSGDTGESSEIDAFHHLEGPAWLPNFVISAVARQDIPEFLEAIRKRAEIEARAQLNGQQASVTQ